MTAKDDVPVSLGVLDGEREKMVGNDDNTVERLVRQACQQHCLHHYRISDLLLLPSSPVRNLMSQVGRSTVEALTSGAAV